MEGIYGWDSVGLWEGEGGNTFSGVDHISDTKAGQRAGVMVLWLALHACHTSHIHNSGGLYLTEGSRDCVRNNHSETANLHVRSDCALYRNLDYPYNFMDCSLARDTSLVKVSCKSVRYSGRTDGRTEKRTDGQNDRQTDHHHQNITSFGVGKCTNNVCGRGTRNSSLPSIIMITQFLGEMCIQYMSSMRRRCLEG